VSQTSYPVVNADHTGAQWRTVQDIGDGIVNDLDGSAYALTVTGSDTCTIGLGTYRVDGTAHEIHTGAETVTLAAVATPTTYLIGIKVDFSVETTPAQLSLVSGVKATLLSGLTGSQRIVPLYEIDRSASTVLSASPRRDYRVWAAEQAYAATLAAASADAPIGAILRTPEGVRLRHLVSGVPAWATLDLKPSAAITPAVGWAAYAGNGPQARVTADGLLVLSGLVSRTGTTVTMTGGTTHHIGTLPAGMRTAGSLRRYPIMQTSAGAANLIVDVDGRLLLRAPAPSSGASSLSLSTGAWVSLDGITVEA